MPDRFKLYRAGFRGQGQNNNGRALVIRALALSGLLDAGRHCRGYSRMQRRTATRATKLLAKFLVEKPAPIELGLRNEAPDSDDEKENQTASEPRAKAGDISNTVR